VLVEYAFAFPILMLVVMTSLSLLWLTAMKNAVTQGAREGARYASTAVPPTYRTHPTEADVAARVNRKVPWLNLDPSNVVIAYDGCPAPCATPPVNAPLTVTITLDLPGPWSVSSSSHGEVRAE
jgi:Flp pilus assembly protein TadG